MDKQQSVYVLSDNRDFIEAFCALVTRELGFACASIASEDDIANSHSGLVISDRLFANGDIPVIIVNLPIRINRLLAEIEKRLTHETQPKSDFMNIGAGLQLSLQNKAIMRENSDVAVQLTDKESQLLQIIVQSGDTGISRESLLKDVWGIDSALDTHTLETHIYRLRKKLRDSFDAEIIKAFEGGYRL